MEDLISRRAAIDAVHEEFDECTVWDESGECTADVVERILDDVPSAQPSPCDACRYAAPSSMDGKPCAVCPAEGR